MQDPFYYSLLGLQPAVKLEEHLGAVLVVAEALVQSQELCWALGEAYSALYFPRADRIFAIRDKDVLIAMHGA